MGLLYFIPTAKIPLLSKKMILSESGLVEEMSQCIIQNFRFKVKPTFTSLGNWLHINAILRNINHNS